MSVSLLSPSGSVSGVSKDAAGTIRIQSNISVSPQVLAAIQEAFLAAELQGSHVYEE